MVTKELREAAVEFNAIIGHCSEEIQKRIPNKFKEYLKGIESKTYKFEYDENKKIEDQNIKPETKGLIALVYRDYITEDKVAYIARYKQHIIQKEKENREKDQMNVAKQKGSNLPIEVEQKSFYKRILKVFKKIFNIN